jgi:glycosyltransferase involved in cell wall biosynthesis
MKIIYFHQHFSTPNGSTGIRSYEMARGLLAKGHHVIMVCGSYSGGKIGLTKPFENGQRRGIIDGIEVIEFELPYSNVDNFAKRTLTFAKFSLRSIWVAMTEHYDILFATTTPLTAGIPGILARWLRGKPFVFEVRDLWPELPRALGVIRNPVILWSMGVLEWISYRSAHRLIGLSPGIVDGIARSGVRRDRILTVPNGCDLDIFNVPVQPWRPSVVSPTDLMAIFAGTHGIANGLEAVLDAAAELKKRGRNDIKLLLIGQGKLKGALQARAEREDLNNVVFHEPVNKARLAGLMAASDIGLQILANIPAFYYGTSPNKFFDYISSSLPVLTNYPGWVADLINEYRAGFVVPPENPSAFADALEKAASDRKGLNVMGQNSLALARAQFARQTLADKWVHWVTGVKS